MKYHPWEQEYRKPQFLSLGTEPLAQVKDFFRTLRRKRKVDTSEWRVLDLGCGNGKNLMYAVDQFCKSGIGYDISETAISQAKELSTNLSIAYEVRSIGERYPLKDEFIDLIIDATSSHCLGRNEREVYLKEVYRVLKPGGFLFVRALCSDGDANAKKLMKEFPGTEAGSYILPGTNIQETVLSEKELRNKYSKLDLQFSEKTSGYQRWGNQSYKRNYWTAWYTKK